ncbi:MAG: peptidylprolyl isomerase [Flavobacteriaceae bacterium]|nr:peptidylprolyl isomerase [Flavobacteriaceae bacterium]
MKKFLLLVLITFSFLGCENNESKPKPKTPKVKEKKEKIKFYTNEEVEAELRTVIDKKTAVEFLTEYGKENPETKVRLKTRLGDIDILLYKDTPLHRANFIYLIKEGYYSNTQFHRVVEDFIIQAGRSDTPEAGEMRKRIGKYTIPAEFNGKRHHKGAVSAARQWQLNPKKKSDTYEFYIIINKKGAHHLNNEHTVFGRVIKGLDVVDKIGQLETFKEWPIEEVHIKAIVLE